MGEGKDGDGGWEGQEGHGKDREGREETGGERTTDFSVWL